MKMQFFKEPNNGRKDEDEGLHFDIAQVANLSEAEEVLYKLAEVFFPAPSARKIKNRICLG